MASAFDAIYQRFTAVYRPSALKTLADAPPAKHFEYYGVPLPRQTYTFRRLPVWLIWTNIELFSFWRFLRKQPSDTIVYTRNARFSLASAHAGFGTFIELHDPLVPMRKAWLRQMIRRRQLAGIVATTTQLKDDLLAAFADLDFPQERILVAGNAACASYAKLPAIARKHLSPNFNVGYAGSAFRGKGIEVCLACAARLPDVTFHIIGADQTTCAAIGPLSPNVVFHGRKSHVRIIPLLKGMDALLLPNQRSVIIRSGADIGRHTSPLKMFEYMSTGRPIIASDLPVLAHVLRNNENALLCPPEDIDAFCAHIQRLRQTPALGQSLGARALADFLASHTWSLRAQKIRQFIETTLASLPPLPPPPS